MLSQSRIEAIKRAAFNHGEKQGMAQGMAQGRNNALLETARKMQAAGADSAYIKEMTGIEL